MSTSAGGSLVIITCKEPKPELDLSPLFNLNPDNTSVIPTPGGRTEGTVGSIYQADQTKRIAMIAVIQHAGGLSFPSPTYPVSTPFLPSTAKKIMSAVDGN
ncbi:hypothetical protein PtrSN002B_009522 [Pyrenophora tritici-repentis]|uniref:Uncharacterized protein n=2 Tax=Pyrenophora tritici-repentis TaxID=45151 RepID=A0A2W1FNB2_9PLEO|nr:uncharacterized protein PTRG_01740 [Pyrenophora tritici-repentis Pt-1C-BFP]KAA8626436.1 hypothetical protein PtrV1_02116 [Pyrenophora tritici-repentis]EDU41178.1 predicted protein [Pyrenophora tritici-repentis Pt-1C-BFP]KAF7454852.1 hypothetical protein A1F99_021100 [Pyrenophora tritici-repentis]KAF7577999.1 hypothetical protein PtrM4_022390 [Pyrenophora tritici-repentis]KAI0572043.1 hypothetical protein Alg215_10017 [Pyrenophora tritici-repentis]